MFDTAHYDDCLGDKGENDLESCESDIFIRCCVSWHWCDRVLFASAASNVCDGMAARQRQASDLARAAGLSF